MADMIGQTLLDQFRVEAFIAAGGMGAVYRVWDTRRNTPLAMKVLHTDLADDPSIFKRFQREARALKKLTHPNIVPFYGLYETIDFVFLLERYVDGATLKQILRRREGKPLPVDEALIYLKALTSALGYAHTQGVVHCDVKPGNVIVERGGAIYLTDFGVARHAESTTTTLGFAGTAAYMAPEQIRGQAVTAETDVYALGVMLYEMLTGRRPFLGDEKETEKVGSTASERVRFAHLHLPPPDPQQFNEALPELLAAVVLKAMAKQPGKRYPNVHALFQAACEAMDTSPESVPPRAPGMTPVAGLPAAIGAASEQQNPIQNMLDGLGLGKKLSAGWWAFFAVMLVGAVALILSSRAGGNGNQQSANDAPREIVEVVVTATPARAAVATQQPTQKPDSQSPPGPTQPPATATAIPPSPTSPPPTATLTFTPDPAERLAQEVEADVRAYWSYIDTQQFEKAWDVLTLPYKEKYLENDYDNYREGWQYTESATVERLEVLSVDSSDATVDVWVVFTAGNVVVEKAIRLDLIYSSYTSSWRIHDSRSRP